MATVSQPNAEGPLPGGPPAPVAADERGSDVAASVPPADVPVLDDEQWENRRYKRFLIFQAAPAWLVSTLFHVAVLLILGLVTLANPQRIVNVLTAAVSEEEGPEIEEFAIEQIKPVDDSHPEDVSETSFELDQPVEEVEPIAFEAPLEVATVPIELAELSTQMAPAGAKLRSLASMNMPALSSRGGDMRAKLLREYGGTPSSEAAVREALKWLALHQMPSGAWTFNHSIVCKGRCRGVGEPQFAECYNAATALGLLPFFGAGQTHYEGEFQNVVRKGLLFLIKNGQTGTRMNMQLMDLSERRGTMYSHGLATIALSEAYAMTKDPALLQPTQSALNFITYAQCRDGGWRYRPQQADGGDTSVVGWQLMALKSGFMGHLVVPNQTIFGAKRFLDKVQGKGGAIYGYASPPSSTRPACTAIGLLCRMYTGWDRTHPGLSAGVEELARIGVLKNNIYYDYYAAQVLRHNGGEHWDAFNTELRDWLVSTQSQQEGAKGSWYFPDSAGHTGPVEGGRLLSTAFATMILEVYYRHMPLYADSAAKDDFPL